MLEVNRVRGYLYVQDDSGKVVGVMVTTSGEVALTRPSGTPGRVIPMAKMSREEAREFAQAILELIGTDDA